jgi:endoglucanase Acf2
MYLNDLIKQLYMFQMYSVNSWFAEIYTSTTSCKGEKNTSENVNFRELVIMNLRRISKKKIQARCFLLYFILTKKILIIRTNLLFQSVKFSVIMQ